MAEEERAQELAAAVRARMVGGTKRRQPRPPHCGVHPPRNAAYRSGADCARFVQSGGGGVARENPAVPGDREDAKAERSPIWKRRAKAERAAEAEQVLAEKEAEEEVGGGQLEARHQR
jgi:hypothetical protein